jgi:hypothetical protein
MSDMSQGRVRNLLTFPALVEVGTGLALLIDPRFVVGLLVGAKTPVEEIPMGRLPGIAILALGLGSPAFRGMLVYNALIAPFLAYLFVVGHLGGVLLWPAVVLHAVVALLLVWLRRDERREAR